MRTRSCLLWLLVAIVATTTIDNASASSVIGGNDAGSAVPKSHWRHADSVWSQMRRFEPHMYSPDMIELRSTEWSGHPAFTPEALAAQYHPAQAQPETFKHDPLMTSIHPHIVELTQTMSRNLFGHSDPMYANETGSQFFDHPFIRHLQKNHIVTADGKILPMGVVGMDQIVTYLHEWYPVISSSTATVVDAADHSQPRATIPPVVTAMQSYGYWDTDRRDTCSAVRPAIYDGVCCGFACTTRYSGTCPRLTVESWATFSVAPPPTYDSTGKVAAAGTYIQNACGFQPFKAMYTSYCSKRKDKCTDINTNCNGDGGGDCGPGVSGGYSNSPEAVLHNGFIFDRPFCSDRGETQYGCATVGGIPLYKHYYKGSNVTNRDKFVAKYAGDFGGDYENNGLLGYMCPTAYTPPQL